ncbi:hypothetical protein ABAZ39_07370 [Azospirillum argentinense]|uniref:Uncharacterized protein n=1 Tax=Azospirillum argentinense TaxID=2970906 RepID=A0A060DLX2_9PROT|nr:hypothetical protein [Azospirillum argentinense]AIB11819.1 hypothetical protein ABAZ39_07370 [Azospirillum argentinense]EZQ08699.1 hypothetical protein ABAZ39_08785 [Azospirillum argentinense]
MTDKTARPRRVAEARGRFIWGGPTENDVILGEVYDKGPGSGDPEEMAKVWAASYQIMFPALAKIRTIAREAINDGAPLALGTLRDIADVAAAALPVPTSGDVKGSAPEAPRRPAVEAAPDLTETAKRIAYTWSDTKWPGGMIATPDEFWDSLDEGHKTAWIAAARAVSAPAAAPQQPLPVGYITLPVGLHPDTAKLVTGFAEALAAKLRLAEVKYGYSDGWRRGDWRDELVAKLAEHVHKGDPRDVAAYCAFAWFHGWSLAPAAAPGGVEGWRGTLDSITNSEEPGGPVTISLTMRMPSPKWVTFQAVWDALQVEVLPLPSAPAPMEAFKPLTHCAAGKDGDCIHPECPQLRDGEPAKSRRHCPLDTDEED